MRSCVIPVQFASSTFNRPSRSSPDPVIPSARRSPIPAIYGHVTGLRPSQVAAIERLYRRRVPQDKVLTPELAKTMCQLTLDIRRPLAVLVTRRGLVQEIIVGTDLALSPITAAKFRAGPRSLR